MKPGRKDEWDGSADKETREPLRATAQNIKDLRSNNRTREEASVSARIGDGCQDDLHPI